MITFFSILLVLIAVNALLLISSFNSVKPKRSGIEKDLINNAISETYRLNFKSSKYKEVIQ